MSKLTFQQLRTKNKERVGEIHNCDNWSYPEWLMATTGELGELANLLKKVKRGSLKWNSKTKKEVAKEIADVQIYLDLLADHLEIDLGQATIDKFNEVSKRYKCKIKL